MATKAISDLGNGNKGDFRPRRSMCDSESQFKSEPNAFKGESSDSLFDSNSEAISLDAEGGEDTGVEILGEVPSSVPTHGIGKGLMVKQPMMLAVVYCDGSHIGMD
ncbi:unnamed protein product [Prunus armeniaca]